MIYKAFRCFAVQTSDGFLAANFHESSRLAPIRFYVIPIAYWKEIH